MLLFCFLLPLVLAQAPRPFDGTYTVVNKANSRRMFASVKDGLFMVDDSGPIYYDQMWVFAPQENQSYAIINAANGMRVLAQSTSDGQDGFFAIDHGPVYQDQRWRFLAQVDGSYTIENVKSSRRISAEVDRAGKQTFAAMKGSGAPQVHETWWLINQERDESAHLWAAIEVKRARVAQLTEDAALAQNVSTRLLQRLEDAVQKQRQEKLETESWKSEATKTSAHLRQERVEKAKLLTDAKAHQAKLLRLKSTLEVEQSLKAELLADVKLKENLRRQVNTELEEVKSDHADLSGKLRSVSSDSVSMAAELNTARAARDTLLESVSNMHSEVARLTSQLNVTAMLNDGLAAKVSFLETLPECMLPMQDLDIGIKLIGTAIAIMVAACAGVCGKRHLSLLTEVARKRKQISRLEQELQAEVGDMVSVGDSSQGLGSDFGFCIFDTEINQEAVRLIKMQCPGVKHADVEIELIFNGCEVTIHRQASRGVDSATWKRRFQFKPSDALFEFREEQMLLEDGFLQLVFRTCGFQSRLVFFPRHFNLADSDADARWDYAADTEVNKVDEADAWWLESDSSQSQLEASPAAINKSSLLDADTVSTASSARALV